MSIEKVKKELGEKLHGLKAKFEANPANLEEALSYEVTVKDLLDFDGEGGKEILKKQNLYYQIKNLEKTLNSELIEVTGKYLFVEQGKPLISPAGVSTETKIFLKPKGVHFQTNKLPKVAPGLVYYKF